MRGVSEHHSFVNGLTERREDGDPRTGAKNRSIRNSFQFEVSTVLPVA
jgi:hypothetical protein